MVNIKSLLFLAPAVTALVAQPRDLVTASTIIQDIMNIDTGVNALTASLEAYNGSAIQALPIGSDILAIHLANRKGYADALLIAPQDSADSNAIIDYTFQSVGIDIPHSVDVLKSKKQDFEAAGMTDIVLGGLELLKNDHDTFSAALLNKTSPDTTARGAVVVKIIDDALQSGIDDYSS